MERQIVSYKEVLKKYSMQNNSKKWRSEQI